MYSADRQIRHTLEASVGVANAFVLLSIVANALGEYHGLIMFPSEYRELVPNPEPHGEAGLRADSSAFKPPDVKMFTPSGRFEVGHKICMSMTS